MPVHDVRLHPGVSIPTVEVIFGQAQVGNYQCVRWADDHATTAIPLANGNNIDNLPDVFALDLPANALSGSVVGFSLLIQSPSGSPGELFSYTIMIRQDGTLVSGGLIQGQGALAGPSISLLEYARFA